MEKMQAKGKDVTDAGTEKTQEQEREAGELGAERPEEEQFGIERPEEEQFGIERLEAGQHEAERPEEEQLEAERPEEEQFGIERLLPAQIEERSFAIISQELTKRGIRLSGAQAPIIKRCIHTSADFDYAKNLVFSEGAVKAGLSALREGACIVTDTKMAYSGINKKRLGEFGGEVFCFMADEDVAKRAADGGITRAAASMEKACALKRNLIFAIGNAPTALIWLCGLIRQGRLRPKLVIGAPVGFVNVVQSKEMVLALEDVPYIVARGRKGGSNIAACICNALIYQL